MLMNNLDPDVAENPDQLSVGWRKRERRELRARNPPHLLTDERPRLADEIASDEMQLDAPLRVRVCRGEDFVADAGANVELLAQLALQARVERLARLAFSAGEFPVAFEVHAFLPPRDEKPAALLDDGGRYDEGFSHAHSFFIGQTRHFGPRATQIIAPRSISA